MDDEGIDWWELMTPMVWSHALNLLALLPLAHQISPTAELWATRPGGSAAMLAVILNRPFQNFGGGGVARSAARAMHFARLVRRFSLTQIKQIFLDKYDSGHQWRSRFTARQRACIEPVILLPSAYVNVSRMAGAYARLLPGQPFLMVATRQSAKQFVAPPNVQVRDLASYADTGRIPEANSLIEEWVKVKEDLQSSPELRVLSQAGILNSFPAWICNGLRTRNAWREVLQHEPIIGVLCGDDSNPYTRLPVLLANRRNISTVDFHHGALDGLYAIKKLPSDLYLSKNEMERDYLLRVCGLPADRVVMGAPSMGNVRSVNESTRPLGSSIIFFSEPYEIAGMRTEQVYGELLPALCRVAQRSGHALIVKLHPFESLSQRGRIIQEILTLEDRKLITVVDGPLSPELMAKAWCGITVESTTVMDCLQNGVCCFLCSWLAHSAYDYVQQYARFGLGEILEDARELAEIPQRLTDFHNRFAMKLNFSATADPAKLQQWLTQSHDLSAPGSVESRFEHREKESSGFPS